MYTTIACVVLFIVLSIVFERYSRNKRVLLLDIFVFSFCISFIVWIVSLFTLSFWLPQKVVTETHELAAMRTSDGIQGSFVLGSIGSVMEYHVRVKNSNGSVSPFQISADANVEITEDADLKNVGYWKRTVWKYDYSTPIAHWAYHTNELATLISDELKVPVGTVVHSFAAQ